MQSTPFLGEYGYVSTPVESGKNYLPIILFIIVAIGLAYYVYLENQKDKQRKKEQEEAIRLRASKNSPEPSIEPHQPIFLPIG